MHHCAYRVTCCSVLQCVVVCVMYRLTHTTTHCNTLQHHCVYRVTYRRDFILCVYISDKTLFFVSIYQATIYSLCLFIRQDCILCVDIQQSVYHCVYRVKCRRDFILCVYLSGKILFFVSIFQARLYSLCLFIRRKFVLCGYSSDET